MATLVAMGRRGGRQRTALLSPRPEREPLHRIAAWAKTRSALVPCPSAKSDSPDACCWVCDGAGAREPATLATEGGVVERVAQLNCDRKWVRHCAVPMCPISPQYKHARSASSTLQDRLHVSTATQSGTARRDGCGGATRCEQGVSVWRCDRKHVNLSPHTPAAMQTSHPHNLAASPSRCHPT